MGFVMQRNLGGFGLARRVLREGMTLDYACAAYVVMTVAYGLSTIPLFRQGWSGGRLKSSGEVIRFSRRRSHNLEPARQMRASWETC
jgi:hypothetical protein